MTLLRCYFPNIPVSTNRHLWVNLFHDRLRHKKVKGTALASRKVHRCPGEDRGKPLDARRISIDVATFGGFFQYWTSHAETVMIIRHKWPGV